MAHRIGDMPEPVPAQMLAAIPARDDDHMILQTGAATTYATAPWSQPDGLCVDDQDRVWTGLYTTNHGLGRFDAATGTLTRFAPPYATVT